MVARVELAYPFRGRWLVQNSPANRVPSHGTQVFATAYAIDFVPVDARGRSAPFTLVSLVRPEAPERSPGFGRPILAPGSGVVLAVHDGEPDHEMFRGLPSVRYALTQGRRAATGWAGLAGNHVLIELEQGAVVALCHLRLGSISVLRGQQVATGTPLGQCGNSGNSTEPHLHLQAMNHPDADSASAVPLSFARGLPRDGDVVIV